jgi:hypothetical protein
MQEIKPSLGQRPPFARCVTSNGCPHGYNKELVFLVISCESEKRTSLSNFELYRNGNQYVAFHFPPYGADGVSVDES